jgi:TRAP-type C4-dicarboxylate transport system permease small subunit
VTRILFRAIEVLLVVLLGTMVVLVFGNVVLRYGFNSGIVFSEEVSRFVFVWLTLFGALLALRERAHLGMTSFIAALPVAGRRAVRFVSDSIILMCCVMLAHGAWKQTLLARDDHSPVTGLSMAWVVGALAVVAAAMALLVAVDLWRQATGRFPADQLVPTPGGSTD